MFFRIKVICLLGWLLLTGGCAYGQAVTNGSFENSAVDPGSGFERLFANSTSMPGWVVSSGSIDHIGTYWKASDGRKSIDLNGTGPGALTYKLPTQPGKVYRLRFDLAGNPNCPGEIAKVLELTAAGATATYPVDVSTATNDEMKWQSILFEFTANQEQTSLVFTSRNDGHCGPAIDNVRFVQVDCAGTEGGSAVIDQCGECLLPTDPDFDAACLDCAGVRGGEAMLDDCGVCLLPDASEFNQSCLDCAGVPAGAAVYDDCGICLEPSDSLFNASCVDCAGVPNGKAVYDDCGSCLVPSDSLFNGGCTDCLGVANGNAALNECGRCLDIDDPDFYADCREELYVPGAFSPHGDGENDFFEVFKYAETEARVGDYLIFTRWGELVYQRKDFAFDDDRNWWDGTFRDRAVDPGVYTYLIQISFLSGRSKTVQGEVMVVGK